MLNLGFTFYSGAPLIQDYIYLQIYKDLFELLCPPCESLPVAYENYEKIKSPATIANYQTTLLLHQRVLSLWPSSGSVKSS